MNHKFGRALLLVFLGMQLSSVFIPAETAEARAGRGRSVGRSFGGSSQYRRSSPPPASQPSQPSYSRPTYPSATPERPLPPPPQAAPAGRGSFLKGLAGGLAGGLLGSMLFGSMGHAGGFGGGYGGMGGGVGFMEILLLAGLFWLAYRFFKKKQEGSSPLAATLGNGPGLGNSSTPWQPASEPPVHSHMQFPGLLSHESEGISKDTASDIFFRIQGAWTRRDLSSVRDILGPELESTLQSDLKDLLDGGRINRLENISIRSVEIVRSWHDQGADYSTVCFLANLLDYTVDEKSARILEGSDTVPVKFEEYWTFSRRNHSSSWRLMGIEQG